MHRCTSFRYARCTTCGREARGMESNLKTVFDGGILKREGPAGATEDPDQGRKGPRP